MSIPKFNLSVVKKTKKINKIDQKIHFLFKLNLSVRERERERVENVKGDIEDLKVLMIENEFITLLEVVDGLMH